MVNILLLMLSILPTCVIDCVWILWLIQNYKIDYTNKVTYPSFASIMTCSLTSCDKQLVWMNSQAENRKYINFNLCSIAFDLITFVTYLPHISLHLISLHFTFNFKVAFAFVSGIKNQMQGFVIKRKLF